MDHGERVEIVAKGMYEATEGLALWDMLIPEAKAQWLDAAKVGLAALDAAVKHE